MFGRLVGPFLAIGAILGLGLVSLDASAAVPRLIGTPRVRNTTFHGVPNTMMYDVRVTVDSTGKDAGHQAIVGYVSADEYTNCASPTTQWKWGASQQFDTTKSRTWTLYNFVPETVYYYKVIVGDPAGSVTRTTCGILETAIAPTPRIPDDLAALNIQYRKAGKGDPFETQYVMLETDDCGGTMGGPISGARYYLVVLDPDAEAIVWYLDIGAMTGLENASGSGFHFVAGATPDEDRVLMTVNKQFLYEWAMDGRQTNLFDVAPGGDCDGTAGADGPCVHHDAFTSESSGNTYVLSTGVSTMDQTGTVWAEGDFACEDSLFLDDGFQVLDESFDVVSTHHLMTDYGYDPTVDGGPGAAMHAARPSGCFSDNWEHSFDPAHGLIDWTHINSVSASSFGGSEVIDISLKEWSQVVRFDAATGDLLWTLSTDDEYSDWDVRKFPALEGAAIFIGQHDVHATSETTLMLYDNRGDPNSTRVLELELDPATYEATIRKSWALVNGLGDPLVCGVEGTGQYVPGTKSDRVLAICGDRFTISELSDSTGAIKTIPPLAIELPDTAGAPYCTSGGPADRRDLQGWHKAYPMANVGRF
jgi:hypothetical protein